MIFVSGFAASVLLGSVAAISPNALFWKLTALLDLPSLENEACRLSYTTCT